MDGWKEIISQCVEWMDILEFYIYSRFVGRGLLVLCQTADGQRDRARSNLYLHTYLPESDPEVNGHVIESRDLVGSYLYYGYLPIYLPTYLPS